MATAIRLGRQTYGTNEDGTLVPYPEIGVVDQPGQLVTAYEDGSGALLGSAFASETPNASGTYAGWYAYSIPISTWSPSAGVLVSGATATGSTGSVSLSASLPVSGAETTGATGSVTIEVAGNVLNVSGATALGSTSSTSLSGSLPVSGATSTGATGSVTLEEGAGGGEFTDNFDDSSIDAAHWSVQTAGGGTVTETTELRVVSATVGTDAAAVVLKQSGARGTATTITALFKPNTAAAATWFRVMQGASQPVAAAEATINAATLVGSIYNPGWKHNLHYYSMAGDFTLYGESASSTDIQAGTTYKVAFEINGAGTQFRISLRQTNDTIILDSGWQNWSTVRSGSTPLWIVLGDLFTDSQTIDMSFTQFSKV
jgi:hypothetical protein